MSSNNLYTIIPYTKIKPFLGSRIINKIFFLIQIERYKISAREIKKSRAHNFRSKKALLIHTALTQRIEWSWRSRVRQLEQSVAAAIASLLVHTITIQCKEYQRCKEASSLSITQYLFFFFKRERVYIWIFV